MKRAAAELHVTAGAVSQHIKRLEAQFGAPLIARHGTRTVLTARGRELFATLDQAFGDIDRAVLECDDAAPRSKRLAVTTTPSFAGCWLASRLGRFTAEYPDIEIKISATPQITDLSTGENRHCYPPWFRRLPGTRNSPSGSTQLDHRGEPRTASRALVRPGTTASAIHAFTTGKKSCGLYGSKPGA